MGALRRLAIGSLLVTVLPWAFGLVVVGVWLMGSGTFGGALAAGSGLVWRSIGLCGVFGGQLVFVVCVCDRVFPSADRRWCWTVESVLCGGFVASCVGLITGGVWCLV